jgi:hypothetical protein
MIALTKFAGMVLGVTLLFVGPVCPAFAQDESQPTESVCLQCHGSQSGRLGEPVGLWRRSIHAANGISCHDCHGGDPTDFAMAMSPERGFLGAPDPEAIPDFCGRCHVGVKEDYLVSHHGQALGSGGPQCVTCHGNHAVVKASLDLINQQDCTRCHDFARAQTIKDAVSATDLKLAGLTTDLAELQRIGITVDKLQGSTFALRNDFHRLFHSVDVELVRQQTSKFQERAAQIRSEIRKIQAELKQRKFWGVLVAALLFLASALFFLLRKTYHEEEDQK